MVSGSCISIGFRRLITLSGPITQHATTVDDRYYAIAPLPEGEQQDGRDQVIVGNPVCQCILFHGQLRRSRMTLLGRSLLPWTSKPHWERLQPELRSKLWLVKDRLLYDRAHSSLTPRVHDPEYVSKCRSRTMGWSFCRWTHTIDD
jgi:hypothetical protein